VSGERLRVHTVYFGGGTPSLLPAFSIAKILHTLEACFELVPEAEISLEANPGTLSLSYLQDLFAIGVNRLSLGMQSAHPRELAFLERHHCFDDVLESAKWTRQAGIDNLSLDLIFGLPEQPIEIWDESLNQALNLDPKHFSLYSLTIESGTPMHSWAARGLIHLPDPDLAAEMYELACEKLSTAGYMQYEISNWAKVNSARRMRNDDSKVVPQISYSARCVPNSTFYWACHHNLQYWRNQSYFGIGSGAHGFAGGLRISNVLTPKAYIQRLALPVSLPAFPRTPATVSVLTIDRKMEMSETMMMGLRLTQEGVSRTAFHARFNRDLYDVFDSQIDKLIDCGLLEWVGQNDDILRLTPPGRLLGNRVFSEFI
jgi:oxygen-independent coproporphyrinogen-3 oxidase